MARYQITISDEQLHGLLQGDRGLADLLEAVLNQVLQAQATEYVKAEPYERTEERVGYRNGTRDRALTTRVGALTLEIPQFRNGKLQTDMFERYQRSEQALIVTLMEMAVTRTSPGSCAASSFPSPQCRICSKDWIPWCTSGLSGPWARIRSCSSMPS